MSYHPSSFPSSLPRGNQLVNLEFIISTKSLVKLLHLHISLEQIEYYFLGVLNFIEMGPNHMNHCAICSCHSVLCHKAQCEDTLRTSIGLIC